ncbi:MAG: hypothetical protein ACI9BW_004326 [Gammaproteobacteria bacterium]|jgi:hypothetical protein
MNKGRRCVSIAAVICAAFIYTHLVRSEERAPGFTASTLSGLNKIAIQVDGISRAFKAYGLMTDSIVERTRESLADNGLVVVALADSKQDPSVTLLNVKLNTSRNPYGFYSYGVSVEVVQELALNNPHGGFIAQPVWTVGETGVAVPTELSKINRIIDTLVAKFLTDFRNRNPQLISPRDVE